MENITLEQQNQLKSWASERDAILSDISMARSEHDLIVKANRMLTESNTEISQSILRSEGRMLELDKKEREYTEIVSSEIADLGKKKTLLETEVTSLKKDVASLSFEKSTLLSDISILTGLHEKVAKRISVLDQVVDRVTRINDKNLDDVNILISKLKEALTK